MTAREILDETAISGNSKCNAFIEDEYPIQLQLPLKFIRSEYIYV